LLSQNQLNQEACQRYFILATAPKRAKQSKELHTTAPKQYWPKTSQYCLGAVVLHSLTALLRTLISLPP
jgi:hypothetical protein